MFRGQPHSLMRTVCMLYVMWRVVIVKLRLRQVDANLRCAGCSTILRQYLCSLGANFPPWLFGRIFSSKDDMASARRMLPCVLCQVAGGVVRCIITFLLRNYRACLHNYFMLGAGACGWKEKSRVERVLAPRRVCSITDRAIHFRYSVLHPTPSLRASYNTQSSENRPKLHESCLRVKYWAREHHLRQVRRTDTIVPSRFANNDRTYKCISIEKTNNTEICATDIPRFR